MARAQVSGLKRFLLWDYARASWQYDVMVALILAFIFLTPRDVFQDQPRASNIVRLPSEPGVDLFWIDHELLDPVPEGDRAARVEALLKSRYGRREKVFRIEQVPGGERGYMAFTKP